MATSECTKQPNRRLTIPCLSAGCVRLDSQIEAAALRKKLARALRTYILMCYVDPDGCGHLPSVEWLRRLRDLDAKCNWRRDIKAVLSAGFAREFVGGRGAGREPRRYINLKSVTDVVRILEVPELGVAREVEVSSMLKSLPKAKQAARLRHIAGQSTYAHKTAVRRMKKEKRSRVDKSQATLGKELGCSRKTVYRTAKAVGVKSMPNYEFVGAQEGKGRVLTFREGHDACAYAKGMNLVMTDNPGSQLYLAMPVNALPIECAARFVESDWVIVKQLTSTYVLEPQGRAYNLYSRRLRKKTGLDRGFAKGKSLNGGEPLVIFSETSCGTYFLRDSHTPLWDQRSSGEARK